MIKSILFIGAFFFSFYSLSQLITTQSQTKSKIIQAELGDNFDYINQILKLKDQEKIQARIPFIFEIK